MKRTPQAAHFIVLAVTIHACAHGNTGGMGASPTTAPASIQLSTYAGLLSSMPVTVANATHNFIFDTGGGETVITPDIASVIGCVPYGRAIGFRMGGEQVAFEYCDSVRLLLGGVPIVHDHVGVFALNELLPKGAPRVDGVVSLRSFRAQPVTIDLARGTIILETASTLAARTRAMQPLIIRVATGPTGAETAVYVAAQVGGRRVWLLLDSGNGDPVLIAPHVARMAGLTSNEGQVLIQLDSLGPIRLPARTTKMIYDGVLGAPFMRNWVFTLDLPSSHAWAMPATRLSQ